MSNSLLDEASGPPQPSIEDAFVKAAEKRKRITYLAIPLTIGVGLLVAVVYIGGRMVSAKPHAAAAPVTTAPITVPPPPAPAEPAKVEAAKPSPLAPDEEKQPPVHKEAAEVKKEAVSVAKVTPPSQPATPVQPKPVSPLTLITPRTGEVYLQLAALVPHTVLKYLDELRADNLEPCVAPGPTPELLRILVGPFPDKDSLSKAKAKLDAEKIVWIVRAY